MGDTLKLALQLTAVDMMSGVLDSMKKRIVGLGPAADEVGRHFEQMNRHLTAGLKAAAATRYAMDQIAKGITPAADLQEAMINVKTNLMESGKDAKVLNAELARVRATAVDLQKIAPFSAQDVVEIENTFLKAGVKLNDITSKRGAAFAATALATITKDAPATIAEGMVSIAAPFNLKGGNYGELADYLQRVDNASITTVPDLIEGAKYVSGKAAELKISWKEMLQAQGVLAQQGLKGSMGGTALNDFISRLAMGSRIARKSVAEVNAEMQKQGRDPLEFWDKDGKLKSFPVIVANLRKSMEGLTDRQREVAAQKIFGEQGGRAAAALSHGGEGSWESIGTSIEGAITLQQKMDEILKGFNAANKSLSGTAKTTVASIFTPMLDSLTLVENKLNTVVSGVGEFAESHKKITTGANVLLGGAAVGAAGYGVYHLLRAAMSGGKVLSGVGGIKGLLKGGAGTALGIAEGKALQAATGVNPVFVTNWPSGLGGIAGDLAGGVAGGGLTKVLGKGKGVLAAAAGLLPEAGMVAGAGALGYAIGAGINRSLGWLSGKMTGGKYSGAGWLGEKVFDMTHKSETKNDIKLDIAIDGNGRAITKSSDPNTRSAINMKRGSFLSDPFLDMNL
jgi:TP901 family phage tail tape measure protein